MLEFVQEISNILEVDQYWIWLIIGLLLLLGVVKCMYPWRPVLKSKKTKDKNGDEVVIYSKLDM